MKKYLPFIFLGVGILILVLVFVFIRSKKSADVTDDNGTLVELAFSDRPFASLTPTTDGHYLNLKIEKIKVPKATSMDYELLYSLPDGRAQGVPGTADLKNQSTFERKLLAKFSTKFHLQSNVTELTSIDTNFTYVLDKKPKGIFFITMETFGLPSEASVSEAKGGPYGVFASDILPSGSASGWQNTASNIFYK